MMKNEKKSKNDNRILYYLCVVIAILSIIYAVGIISDMGAPKMNQYACYTGCLTMLHVEYGSPLELTDPTAQLIDKCEKICYEDWA